ncbi:hypothetical protein MTO96_007613 [Rhipicephalus appendiculatus]
MEGTSPEGFPQSFVIGDSSDRRKDWDLLLKRASHPPQAGDTTTSPPRPSSSPLARTRARKLRAATTILRENPAPSSSRPRTRGTGKFHTPQRSHAARGKALCIKTTSKQQAPTAILSPLAPSPSHLQAAEPAHNNTQPPTPHLSQECVDSVDKGMAESNISLSERATARSPPPSALPTSSSESSAEEPGTQVSPAAAGSEGETSNQVPLTPAASDDTGTAASAARGTTPSPHNHTAARERYKSAADYVHRTPLTELQPPLLAQPRQRWPPHTTRECPPPSLQPQQENSSPHRERQVLASSNQNRQARAQGRENSPSHSTPPSEAPFRVASWARWL